MNVDRKSAHTHQRASELSPRAARMRMSPLVGRPLKVKNNIKASFYDRQGILFRLKLRQKWHFSTFIYFFYITFTYFRARVSQIIICLLSEIYEKKLKLFGKKTETFREETETFREETETFREETETFREETETFREETPFSTKKGKNISPNHYILTFLLFLQALLLNKKK